MITTTPAGVALASLALMSSDDATLEDFAALVAPDYVNREAHEEPPACRGHGPEAAYATYRWLRHAYGQFAIAPLALFEEDDHVVVHCSVRVTHTGPFVVFDAAGEIAEVMPPTGGTATVDHVHGFRVRDGLATEHWAVRDDLGLAKQLGWVPPSPARIVAMLLARRRMRRQATLPWDDSGVPHAA